MPSNQYGFTGNEIVSRVVAYIGNVKQDFQTFLQQTLPLAEFKFCKMHDWRFLEKAELSLAITQGTTEYELTIATLGYNMAADDVQTITDEVNGRVLKKITLKDMRRFDPKNNDGTPSSQVTHWAPISDQRIKVYPPQFTTVTLKVDGKVTPGALSDLTQYPTIPYKYQETFIEYIIALMLDRENDDRAEQKKQDVLAMIKQDIQNDMSTIGDVDSPRLRSMREAYVDGVGGSAEKDWLNFLFRW